MNPVNIAAVRMVSGSAIISSAEGTCSLLNRVENDLFAALLAGFSAPARIGPASLLFYETSTNQAWGLGQTIVQRIKEAKEEIAPTVHQLTFKIFDPYGAVIREQEYLFEEVAISTEFVNTDASPRLGIRMVFS